jgi:membrane fusion protein (multidrug efflux system)
VPTESLIPIQNGKKIFIAEKGLAKEIIVETGARTKTSVIVLSGLNPGDTVLTSGVMMLRNGIPVKVNLEQPAANSKL